MWEMKGIERGKGKEQTCTKITGGCRRYVGARRRTPAVSHWNGAERRNF